MAFFIELTARDKVRRPGPFLVNVDSIKVVYQGLDGAVLHLKSKVSIEVIETYEDIKRRIMSAEALREVAALTGS